jgi:hypothetical protein
MHCITMMKQGIKIGQQLLLVVLLLVTFSFAGTAQRITYSLAEREDSRRTDFEIIGKVGSNILVFKNNRNENAISVYNNDMKLVERVKLEYVDDRWINVDFVPYTDHVWMIYQFQRRSIGMDDLPVPAPQHCILHGRKARCQRQTYERAH